MPDAEYRLSPYCVLHPHGDRSGATLVHALYGSRFELSPSLLRILADVLDGAAPSAAATPAVAGAADALETLIAEKILVAGEDADRLGQPDLFRSRLEPIELAFHRGFNEGGFFPDGLDQAHPPLMVKHVSGTRSVPLETHASIDVGKDLAQCLAERRSIRAYGDRPLEKRQLEQFLQLTGRAYGLLELEGLGTVSIRNYPSGGARYPLELYPVVYSVEGLEPGIYHYHPYHHRLAALDSDDVLRRELLFAVRTKMGDPSTLRGNPAVLFLVTAVFARTCWKYRGVPYHLILQEVGGLYQTMYLAATQLGLAPCAVGAFPELAVAEMLGVDSRDEAQVGLFALGVPDPADLTRPAMVVHAVRRLEASPFSPDPGRSGLELDLGGGRKEMTDLEHLSLRRDAVGTLTCSVMGGRQRATLDPACVAAVTRLLDSG
jgi:SagB-type dehydrogenase family enzyme